MFKQFQELLEQSFVQAWLPGQALSQDETLIRTYGQIRFKVCIISKSACYGIKMYVITDAKTAFVTKDIMYVSKEQNNHDAELKRPQRSH